MADPIASDLAALFDAERAARSIHARLVRAHGSDPSLLVRALRDEAERARTAPPDEQAVRLVRVANLLGDLHGGAAVDLLIDLLGAEDPEVRGVAGEALEGLAYDRFKEVALGTERALSRLPAGHAALSELPYLLADIPEPGATKLLGRFLAHGDPEAVAAAIEALVEVGDPSGAPMLSPLVRDTRVVQLEDDEGEEGKVTIGELAEEACALLGEIEGTRDGAPANKGKR